jgi:putative DNA primase/helicase
MIGPNEWGEGTPELFAMLERPKKHAPAPVTSIASANVSQSDKLRRASKYLASIPGAVAGQHGHDQTYSAAQAMTVGFDLTDDEAYSLLASEYNPRCSPPWNERELWHKVKTASKQSRKPRGWLLEKKTPPPGVTFTGPSNEWREQLRFSGGGNPKLLKTAQNVQLVLTHDERWHGVVAYNVFSNTTLIRRQPPFARPDEGSSWNDTDDTRLQFWIEREFDVTVPLEAVSRAVNAAAHAAGFHPVREYLNGLQWDGENRLDGWLAKTFEVERSPYSQAVASKWAISAVARIYEPGCKVDHVLVLEGEPRIGKSTAVMALCGNEEWFLDELEEMGTRDSAAQIAGRWIVELGELDTINRSEVSAIKAFISRQVDRYRPAYGHRVVQQPRQCVFIGTVNPGANGYLRDETGNRRFWPVACRSRADIEWLRANRDQLWAEAVARYKGREPWHLVEEVIEQAASAEQQSRVYRDALQGKIEHWLVGREETSVPEVLERMLDLPMAKWDPALQQRVGRALIVAGWVKCRAAQNDKGIRPWVYRRKSTTQLALDLASRNP